MVPAVAPSSAAAIPTTATATSACSNAESERQRDAALPGLLVGDQIGRDHRLAVAGAGGMKNPVGERDAHQQPDRAAVGLGAADRAGEHAVEFGLLGEQPAGDAVGGGRRRRPARAARRTDFARARPRRRARRARRRPSASSRQRCVALRPPAKVFTGISPRSCWRTARRNCSTAPRLLKNASPGLPGRRAPPSPGRATASLHACGAPTRRTGLLLGKREVDEIGAVVHLEIEALRLRGRLERQGEVQREQPVGEFEIVVDRRVEVGLLAVQRAPRVK